MVADKPGVGIGAYLAGSVVAPVEAGMAVALDQRVVDMLVVAVLVGVVVGEAAQRVDDTPEGALLVGVAVEDCENMKAFIHRA